LNGAIIVLASGTQESDAKVLATSRPSWVIQPPHSPNPPKVIVRAPHVPNPPSPDVLVHGNEDVVRGDITGDFLSSSTGGSYQLGRVSGKVKILTHAGEIHVAAAGSDADLKTYGGDIAIGPVAGDLKIQTLGGDVHAGAVTGSAQVETSGGDIRIDRIAGSADLRTGGGDILLASVAGGLKAQTSGGDIKATLSSRESKGGVSILNSGGDVTLVLPADFHGDIDLEVSGCSDQEERVIRSDFPELAITRRGTSQHASGALNGGGPRVVVRTTSGTIRLRKGANAS